MRAAKFSGHESEQVILTVVYQAGRVQNHAACVDICGCNTYRQADISIEMPLPAAQAYSDAVTSLRFLTETHLPEQTKLRGASHLASKQTLAITIRCRIQEARIQANLFHLIRASSPRSLGFLRVVISDHPAPDTGLAFHVGESDELKYLGQLFRRIKMLDCILEVFATVTGCLG